MRHHVEVLSVATPGRTLIELTDQLQHAVAEAGMRSGLVTAFVHHTSASLVISENADPVVLRDLEAFASRLAPDGDALYEHTAEGPDDMPAHVRSVFTQASISIPVAEGRADLGTWQGLFLWEHRHAPHRRKITITVVGE